MNRKRMAMTYFKIRHEHETKPKTYVTARLKCLPEALMVIVN